MMKKSMDDDILREKIIALLKEHGASSSDGDLNVAVMNMLKILPPPVIKLDIQNSLPTRSKLSDDEIPYPSPKKFDFSFIDLFAGSEAGGQRLAILYSFAATCKANGICFRKWLEDVLPRLNSTPAGQIDLLIPKGEAK